VQALEPLPQTPVFVPFTGEQMVLGAHVTARAGLMSAETAKQTTASMTIRRSRDFIFSDFLSLNGNFWKGGFHEQTRSSPVHLKSLDARLYQQKRCCAVA